MISFEKQHSFVLDAVSVRWRFATRVHYHYYLRDYFKPKVKMFIFPKRLTIGQVTSHLIRIMYICSMTYINVRKTLSMNSSRKNWSFPKFYESLRFTAAAGFVALFRSKIDASEKCTDSNLMIFPTSNFSAWFHFEIDLRITRSYPSILMVSTNTVFDYAWRTFVNVMKVNEKPFLYGKIL